jgi:DHA1 family bicyclomycin/chloramphenicol resistance-like MFS transporter
MSSLPHIEFLNRKTPPHISTMILLTGLSALAMNIFLPSLPSMAAHFETDYAVMQLSVGLYLGFSGILQLFIGPLSDKFGRRPIILGGLFLFLLATLGCIYAPTAESFLIFRMLQAVIAVAMVLTRAVVRDIAPQDEAASLMGYITMGMAVVPMLGPAVGGIFAQWFGWQSNFWILIALGVFALWLAYADMGETAPKSDQTVLGQFSQYPELLKSPRFWGYCLATALSAGSFFAYLGGAPYVGSEVFGLDPATLGFFFGAPAIGYMLGNFLTGKLATRYGINILVAWGCVFNALGCALSLAVIWMGYGTIYSFFGFMTFVGLGNGLTIANGTVGMLSVRPHLAGTASGLGGSMMIGGGACLSALAGAVLTPGSGADPLLWLMLICSLLGLVAIAYVIYRQRQIGL